MTRSDVRNRFRSSKAMSKASKPKFFKRFGLAMFFKNGENTAKLKFLMTSLDTLHTNN